MIGNIKGGVGKTLLATNIAAVLAKRGDDVADAKPRAGLTTLTSLNLGARRVHPLITNRTLCWRQTHVVYTLG